MVLTHKIICGDCIEVMKKMESDSVDLVLTDPPYNVGKDFGNESDKQGEKQYLSMILSVSSEVKRILRWGGLSFWFFSIKHLPVIFRQFQDWNYLWTLCWIAKNKRSMSVFGYNLWQPILCFGKSGKSKWLKNQDVYYATTGQEKYNHPTPKPLKLIMDLIKDFSVENDTILDPFLGSGTTSVAAERLGRNSIGIEISKEYCEIAYKRLLNEVR